MRNLIVGPSNKAAVDALNSNVRQVWLWGASDTGKSFIAQALRPRAVTFDPVDESKLTAAYLDQLRACNAQITFVSHAAPRDCIKDSRVLTRCVAGAIVKLEEWEAPMRTRLLMQHAPAMPLSIARKLVEAVSGGPRSCVGLACGWKARGGPRDDEALAELIRDYGGKPMVYAAAHPGEIMVFVANKMHTSTEKLCGHGRTRMLTWPRHVAMYLIKELCPLETLVSIGAHMGGRDHSTVLHAINKMRSRVRDDVGVAKEMAQLKRDYLSSIGAK